MRNVLVLTEDEKFKLGMWYDQEIDKKNTCWYTGNSRRPDDLICDSTCGVVFNRNRLRKDGCPCEIYKERYVMQRVERVLMENLK